MIILNGVQKQKEITIPGRKPGQKPFVKNWGSVLSDDSRSQIFRRGKSFAHEYSRPHWYEARIEELARRVAAGLPTDCGPLPGDDERNSDEDCIWNNDLPAKDSSETEEPGDAAE